MKRDITSEDRSRAYHYTRYRDALEAFSAPGNRWDYIGTLTWHGKAAGMAAEDIIREANERGVHDRNGDIRRGWESAKPDAPCHAVRIYAPGNEDALRKRKTRLVRELIEAGGGKATFDDLAALSPMRQVRDIEDRPALQTLYFLLNLWRRDDLLFVFNKSEAGRPGDTLRTREAWTDILELPGDKIVPNPFSGERGETNEGKPSFIADACICRFPYALLEFDDMPLEQQAAFWRGFIRKYKNKLASLVYSGGKSIHGLLNVGAASKAEWDAERGKLLALFASDEEPEYRADAQSLRVRQGTRIAGVTRADTGKVQRLLYIAPAEAAETP